MVDSLSPALSGPVLLFLLSAPLAFSVSSVSGASLVCGVGCLCDCRAPSSASSASLHRSAPFCRSMSGVSGGGGYGEKQYWDQRYANEDKYEWYLSYGQFKSQLLPHLQVADYPAPSNDDTRPARSSVRLLVVGCGNSELSKQLFDDGFSDVVSIDYSEVVIEKMNQTYRDTPELKCRLTHSTLRLN